MAKTYIQRIAEVVAAKHNLSLRDAEAFVAAMFEVAHEGLEQDKQVKIKGLGTFKVVPVKSRESVNVNTGERITLEGHDKVSFTPDTSMKELVNKPFAQFETVVLNDGVDLSAIDKEFEQTEETPKEEVVEEAPKEEVFEETPKEEIVEETPKEEIVEETPKEEVVEETPKEEVVEEAPKEEVVEETPKEEVVEETPKEEIKEEELEVEEQKEEAQPTVEEESSVAQVGNAEEEEEESHGSHRRTWTLVLLGVLIALAVAAYFGYNQMQDNEPLPPLPTRPERPKPAVVEKPKPQPVDTLAALVAKANQDPRVRVGGYDIIGVDTVITLQAGQTMQGYCSRTLGRDMIVYFQALNGKDTMKAGEKMKVPKVVWRKKVKK